VPVNARFVLGSAPDAANRATFVKRIYLTVNNSIFHWEGPLPSD